MDMNKFLEFVDIKFEISIFTFYWNSVYVKINLFHIESISKKMGRMLYTVNMPTLKDRAAGAIMGALIGDALGLGCHWYYDLDELHRLFGPWISDYTEPKPGGYHSGMKAGELSQAG